MWESIKSSDIWEPNRILLLLIAVALVASTWAASSSVRLNGRVEAVAENTAKVAADNSKAICALSAERKEDIARTERFLEPYADKPADYVISLGDYEVSKGAVESQLEMMYETVEALSHVTCPAPTP